MKFQNNKLIFEIEEIPVKLKQSLGIKLEGKMMKFIIGKGKYKVKINDEIKYYIDCKDVLDTLVANRINLEDIQNSHVEYDKDRGYFINLPLKITTKKKHERTNKSQKKKVNVRNNLEKYIFKYKAQKEIELQRNVTLKEIYSDIGDRIGCGEETIKKIKENKVNPSIETAYLLCEFFNITLDDIYIKL